MAAISKVTAKGQTTVPREVRTALKCGPGDLIAWDIGADGRVAVRRIQPLDVPLGDLKVAGLPAPSIVRFKLFTLDHRLVQGKLGRLAEKDQANVHRAIRRLLP